MYNRKHMKLVNLPMLLRVAGWLMMIEALFMLIPLATCLAYGEDDWLAFAPWRPALEPWACISAAACARATTAWASATASC